MMSAAAVQRVADCILERVWPGVLQRTEPERITDQINTAMIFVRANS
jgi:hypothetical protein